MPIDRKKYITSSVILDRDVHKKLKCIAEESKRSLSKQIAFILEKYIDEYYKEK